MCKCIILYVQHYFVTSLKQLLPLGDFKLGLLLRPCRGAEYCDRFVCVCSCLCVCLSASISGTTRPIFFCANPLWPWLGPALAALRYIMVLWMTSHVAMHGLGVAKYEYQYSTSSGVAESDVYECLV